MSNDDDDERTAAAASARCDQCDPIGDRDEMALSKTRKSHGITIPSTTRASTKTTREQQGPTDLQFEDACSKPVETIHKEAPDVLSARSPTTTTNQRRKLQTTRTRIKMVIGRARQSDRKSLKSAAISEQIHSISWRTKRKSQRAVSQNEMSDAIRIHLRSSRKFILTNEPTSKENAPLQPAPLPTNKQARQEKMFLEMLPSKERRPASRIQLSSCLQVAIGRLLPLLLVLTCAATLAHSAGHHANSAPGASAPEGHYSSVLHPNSDLLTVLPPFAPTRRPSNSVVDGPPTGSSSSTTSFYEPALQRNQHQTAPMSAYDSFVNTDRAILHGSASAISGSNVPQGVYQASALKPTKFTRTNELDAFLDEMNHNELQTVAAGKPIDDMFLPKPGNNQHQQLGPGPPQAASHQQQHQHHRSESNDKAASDRNQLVGSHSEQQIYSECALILQRTYVKNIDDPKHQLVPFGKTEQACISYKHIDKAVEQAKHKLKFREFAKMRKKPMPGDSPMSPPVAPLDVIHSSLEPPEDLVAAIGELNMATTQIIADQFDLSNDELLNGLPLIDMSRTKFWDLCPLFVKQDLKCEISRFRTFTGHCNNIKHPTWGAAKTPYARYLPPVHPDGIWVPRKSIVSEITFDLGVGHRETHANIAPSMPLPAIHNEPDGHHNFPPHHNIDEPSGSIPPVPHRMGALSIEELAKQADDELAGAHFEDQDVAGSVHFVRRAPMDPGTMMQVEAPLGLEASAVHFQQQPGPLRNLMAPLSQQHHQLQHQHHLSLFQQQQAAVVAAASNHMHHLPSSPPILHQPHKTRSIAQDLPSARLVSSIVHRDMDVPNHDFSMLFMSWGQLLDHDMTRAAQPPTTIKCCPGPDGEPAAKHKLCMPIAVPPNDPFYSKFNVQCLEFRRTLAGVRPNCVLGPRVHQNANTSPIDANFVYGSSREMADALRLFKGGRLRDRDWFHREHLKPLLPAQEIDPDVSCLGRPKDLFCFLAGDIRVNEQTHLTVLHTLYMREHNRLADRLSELNPHWDDERTFQEARHIVAAQTQHVLINEYIPLLIGRKMTELYNLTAQSPEHHIGHHLSHHLEHHHQHKPQYAFWHGYDPSVTTSVSNSFAAAAFRQGHTFVQSTIDRFNKFHKFVASEKLRHLFMQPFLLYQPGVLDELVGGMINRQSQSYDPFMTEELSGHLFQAPEQEFGHDLAAINLQRGRDQGLPGYNLFREWCGLPRAETFDQLEPYLTNHTAYQYSRIYKHVDDIDLWSGGISERKLPGSAIGPTFACIIARQFSNTRRGDRFWYENPGFPSSFTPDQLAEIRKVSLAKLLCTNADDLPTIQRWAFRMAHPILNPRVECHLLPEIDLQFWQEE